MKEAIGLHRTTFNAERAELLENPAICE